MIGEAIARAFGARNSAHRAHLLVSGAGSYARHMALGEFYSGVIEAADTLAEAYIGQFGPFELPPIEDRRFDFIVMLREDASWIEANRTAVPGSLVSLVDDLAAVYWSAIYKLERLS